MKLQKTTFKPGSRVRMKDFDPRETSGSSKEKARAACQTNATAIHDLTQRLYAENQRALLIVLQGMDTAGKDGTIRHLMRGVDAQATEVHPFKKLSSEELDHDFLWRIHKKVPATGNIGIFNRSHYEDVLVVRVHNLGPSKEWKTRYERINDFEKLVTDAGVTILKFFLHISKGDLAERELWNDYQAAYVDALGKCNTRHAPWHIVCADRKWHRNLVISTLLRRTLEKMNPQFPPAEDGLKGIVIK